MKSGKELKALLGVNVKKYRILKRWSQMTLAEMINVSTNTVSEIETGKKFVSADTLTFLAEVFDIDAYELLKPKNILPYEAILSYSEEVKKAMDTITDKYMKTRQN